MTPVRYSDELKQVRTDETELNFLLSVFNQGATDGAITSTPLELARTIDLLLQQNARLKTANDRLNARLEELEPIMEALRTIIEFTTGDKQP